MVSNFLKENHKKFPQATLCKLLRELRGCLKDGVKKILGMWLLGLNLFRMSLMFFISWLNRESYMMMKKLKLVI